MQSHQQAFSIFLVVSSFSAVTEKYTFSFGSVPDGLMTIEPLEIKNFRISDFGKPSIPEINSQSAVEYEIRQSSQSF